MAKMRHTSGWLWQHALFSGLCLGTVVSCDPREQPDQTCPFDMPTPPFRLTVDTLEPTLRPELELNIVYGGNQRESYHPGERSTSPDICCVTLNSADAAPERIPCAGEAPDAATEPLVVVCDLWTSGAANLTIRQGEHVYASQTLQALPRQDIPLRCGLFETTDAHWTYGLGDAGVVIHE